MIDHLRGIVTYKEPNLVVIECGGVGYACRTSMQTAAAVGAVEEAVQTAVSESEPADDAAPAEDSGRFELKIDEEAPQTDDAPSDEPDDALTEEEGAAADEASTRSESVISAVSPAGGRTSTATWPSSLLPEST